ncbi:MAG: histidinol-phosphatase [Verrucomicrobiae bacterium]|nr:histidinol-phosphatase [Verrucomicrobiae bacterium]
MNLEPYLACIRDLAAASSEVILPYFGRLDLGVELKSDASPVTQADRGAEHVMREIIEQRFPDHGIIGEEFGTVREDAEFVWVLDPIDGTRSFVTAVPLFVTLIGLVHRGRPVLGAIQQPVLRQLMIGDGRSTTLNGRPVRVRTTGTLSEATLLTTDPAFPARYQNGAAFATLADRTALYRTFGDGYGYLLVAAGWADIMVDPVMNAWDLLPLIPCIEGAGGKITNWQGGPVLGEGPLSAVACAPGLHGEVIRMLNP